MSQALVALNKQEIAPTVRSALATIPCIDLHTHLFPPSHGTLFLWGPDELLTYHYLISEFFCVAPTDLTEDQFFSLSKNEQADLIWDHLFIRRSPISEACKGVLTTFNKLGLKEQVTKRDLPAIREFFKKQNPEEYLGKVFSIAKVKYAIMTNVPFDQTETIHWVPNKKPIPPQLKSALRVDPILKGDWNAVKDSLKIGGYPETLDGLRSYLKYWVSIMVPVYTIASVPVDFKYPCGNDLFEKVLLPFVQELNLPLVLKIGVEREINPKLRSGGDGIAVADCSNIKRLCSDFPKVKFLVTLLSRENQHEICVLTQKFRNLHLYGCWWYCNNPSIIKEITQIRFELLGTAFTAQHSDARVLDQLIYKWDHSRRIIGDVLIEEYEKLVDVGWSISKDEIDRDVWQILGGEFENFIGLNNK